MSRRHKKKKKHRLQHSNQIMPVGEQPIVQGGAASGSKKSQVRAVSVTTAYSGPIPSPDDFAGYNAVLPGAADRILKMAEGQSSHRQRIETIAVSGNTVSQVLAIPVAGYLAYVVLNGAIHLLETGHQIEGLSALVGAIATMVGVFIYGKRHQTRQLAEKLAAEMAKKANAGNQRRIT